MSLPHPPQTESRLGRFILLISISFALVVGTVTLFIWVVAVVLPQATLHSAEQVGEKAYQISQQSAIRAIKLGKDFAADLQKNLGFLPKIVVDSQTVIDSSPQPILQLATVEQEFESKYSYQHTFLRSTKTILLSAHFTAKAGFDLTKRFEIDISTHPPGAKIHAPPPMLISFEMNNYHVLEEEGYWNKITAEDRQNAVAALQAQAKADILARGILHQAQLALERTIQDALLRHLAKVEFDYTQTSSPQVEPKP